MKLVYVEWVDAAYIGAEWRTKEEAAEWKGYMMRSCGFLVAENELGIYLAADADPDVEGRYRHTSFIPKAMIKRKKVITVK